MILLIASSGLVLAAGIVGLLLIVRARQRRRVLAQAPTVQNDLQTLLQPLLQGPLEEYLRTSSPPRDSQSDLPPGLDRLRHIFLSQPQLGVPAVGREEIAVGLAVLEVRLNNLTDALKRVEEQSVSQDRVVLTVAGVLGTVIAMLGGVVGLVSGISRML
jgi:hypothetical protein